MCAERVVQISYLPVILHNKVFVCLRPFRCKSQEADPSTSQFQLVLGHLGIKQIMVIAGKF